MSDKPMRDEELFQEIARQDGSEQVGDRAPARLKAQIYSSLIRRQQASGPLLDLSSTKKAGRNLCVFEELVEILPVRREVKNFNYCSVCHARFLAERLEHPPIFWNSCPYVTFRRG